MLADLADRVWRRAVRSDADAEATMPVAVRRHVPRNGLRQVAAQGLQSAGDHAVNASTVLPWLLHALGAPGALVGLLVPVRESLSMLPQAMLTPFVLRARQRKAVFVAGALVQAGAAAAIALVAAIGAGLAAGIAILAALAIFALGRCLCSIASKDVQGRTIPKGERGQITGLATTAGGIAAVTLGVGIRVLGGEDASAGVLAWVVAGGAALWVLAALLYSRIREPEEDPWDDAPDASTGAADGHGWARDAWALLREDAQLRRFVGVRSLLLVSALSPPFLVSLAAEAGSGSLVGLGGFVLSAGLAALLGGRIAGRLADRSSRSLMSVGAGLAAAIVVVVVAIAALPGFDGGSPWGSALLVAAYFLLALTHTGVRVARKTYVVDMADGDRRTRSVAVANSAMGVVLLVVGAASAALATLGAMWALLLLAALGAIGVLAARRLPEVGRE